MNEPFRYAKIVRDDTGESIGAVGAHYAPVSEPAPAWRFRHSARLHRAERGRTIVNAPGDLEDDERGLYQQVADRLGPDGVPVLEELAGVLFDAGVERGMGMR